MRRSQNLEMKSLNLKLPFSLVHSCCQKCNLVLMKFEFNGRCNREDDKPRKMEIAHFNYKFSRTKTALCQLWKTMCYGEFIRV